MLINLLVLCDSSVLKSGPFLLLPPYTIKTKRLADTIIYFSVFIFNHSLPNILVCH